MQNIRTIGGVGGVFHILVPGVFLLINIIFCLYSIPFSASEIQLFLNKLILNQTVSAIVIIGFGYLIGVVLRIFRSELPDKLSAGFLRKFDRNARPPEVDRNLYAYEKFPYMKWMGQVCLNMPEDVKKFYKDKWSAQGNSKSFLNFSKIIIISEDERAANEIYSAESLCRYISGMFYGLATSSFLIFMILVYQIVALSLYWIFSFNVPKISSIILLSILFICYLIALVGILWNFRFMRIKEVQTVFYSAYKNCRKFPSNINNRVGICCEP